jgi:hypothetical protein
MGPSALEDITKPFARALSELGNQAESALNAAGG